MATPEQIAAHRAQAVQMLAHGLAGTERIAVRRSASTVWYLFATGQYAVLNANAISLTGWGGTLSNFATICGKYYRDYTAGTDRVGTKLIQNFYLPGVTVGITTPTDIPIPDPLLNDTKFLLAALANTSGYQIYDSTALGPWNKSPIYEQTAIYINMADV